MKSGSLKVLAQEYTASPFLRKNPKTKPLVVVRVAVSNGLTIEENLTMTVTASVNPVLQNKNAIIYGAGGSLAAPLPKHLPVGVIQNIPLVTMLVDDGRRYC